jgi:hypothetical protein
MPLEEQRLIKSPAKNFESSEIKTAVARSTLIVGLLVLILILPLWLTRYPPLYDYQNHLLEAQVLARYEEPQLGYSSFYEIREGWYLRSNALTTLMMAGLGQVIPIDLAGKTVLTFYTLMLGFGLAALLQYTGRPHWLALFLPVLVFNFTFTTGMLNWSFGFALIPWALLFYLTWHRQSSRWALGALSAILLLIYVAHLFAWGLMLGILFTLSAAQGIDRRNSTWLLLASMSAVPMLLVTRPLFALAPVLLFLMLWGMRLITQRLGLSAGGVGAAGTAGAAIFLAGVKQFQPQMQEIFPHIGYSSHTKIISVFQTFALPHYYGSEDNLLVLLNLLLAVLLGSVLIIMLIESLKVYKKNGVDNWKWLAACFLLFLAYFIIPTRTFDIIVTEPRILLTAFFVGIMAIKSPLPESKPGRVILPLLVLTAAVSTTAVWYFTFRYDEAARGWSQQLGQIPPTQRLLVFSNPLPDELNNPFRIGQVFDQHQFANTYPLERGGFSSNTFFNGPLLPVNPASIPPYWWIDFSPGLYIDRYCERLIPEYDLVLLWNPRSKKLLNSLNSCYGDPLYQFTDLWVWRSEPGVSSLASPD